MFTRVGMQFESHLGHVFSLFRGLWASECAQPVHMRSPSGAFFVGAVAVASVLLTYSVDACYLFIVVHGSARHDRFLLQKNDFFPPPGLARWVLHNPGLPAALRKSPVPARPPAWATLMAGDVTGDLGVQSRVVQRPRKDCQRLFFFGGGLIPSLNFLIWVGVVLLILAAVGFFLGPGGPELGRQESACCGSFCPRIVCVRIDLDPRVNKGFRKVGTAHVRFAQIGTGEICWPSRCAAPSPTDALPAAPRPADRPPSQWRSSRTRRRAAYIRATLAFTIR